jgi:antitoxin component of MazEF toxin-antitoxin module
MGFTGLRHAYIQKDIPTQALEKLVLASTQVPGPELVAVLRSLPTLKVLHLDAMGGGQGTAARMGNSTAMTLSDSLLEDITDALDGAVHLEVVSLIGNTKLGLTRRQGLFDFISRVGRRCKVRISQWGHAQQSMTHYPQRLHLSGIRSIKSNDLAGLVPDDAQQSSSLQVLALDNTNVGDDAIPFLATCLSLRTLNAAGTKFTSLITLHALSFPMLI